MDSSGLRAEARRSRMSISYKVPAVEVMAGCAVAMAKYNGLDKVGHIRDKLADIAAYVEAAQRLGMDAVQFESLAQLERELKARGICW